MIDPTEAFQTAVRSTLIASPDVVALVQPENIRELPGRPENFPSILFGNQKLEFLGYSGNGWRSGRVSLVLHIWALENAQIARQIGGAVLHALETGPADTEDTMFLDWQRPTLAWMRDPKPELVATHGAMALECVAMWRP
ncbi:tail completion protein gp17 [Mangrovicoccus ximenensis]|uniref:tail completion protein gp17 n=1 Tax=Mangrovicoccus ximenensis TaxID=1911570 RepID=UPI000D37BE47|nr:DUF3168 domain-containing protein [Mangrovicoccus ximenensis]